MCFDLIWKPGLIPSLTLFIFLRSNVYIWLTRILMNFRLKDFIFHNPLLIMLNLFAIGFYAFIIYDFGALSFIKNNLYLTSDSLEYLGYSKWLSGESDYCDAARTYFYPLLLMIANGLFGLIGPWIMQLLFWIIGCNLVYLSISKLTGRPFLSVISFLIVSTNISVIVYSTHALTETTVFFFLGCLSYLLAIGIGKFNKGYLFFSITFLLTLLVVTKPLYGYLWFLYLLMILIFHFRNLLKKPLLILLFLLASIPFIGQMAINKSHLGTFSNNVIANYNYKTYFFRKVKYFAETNPHNNFDKLPDSVHASMIKKIEPIGDSEIRTFIFSNPIAVGEVIWDNLNQNLNSGNPYIPLKYHETMCKWVSFSATILFYFHLLMTGLWIYFLWNRFKERRASIYLFIFFIGVMTYFILYTSAISFWAGDRLISPAIVLWSGLYPLLIFQSLNRKIPLQQLKV